MNSSSQIEINLDYLSENIKILKKTIHNYDNIMVDLRNNAYGIGVYIINTLVKSKINGVIVSTLKEAIDLREYNTDIPIIITKEIDNEYIYDAINNNVTITISNLEQLDNVVNMKLKDQLKIHLLINSGSNIIGFKKIDDINKAMEIINDSKNIVLDGICTHFNSCGIKDHHYYNDMNKFMNIVKELDCANLNIYANEAIMYHKKKEFINGIVLDLSIYGLKEKMGHSILDKLKQNSLHKKYLNDYFRNIRHNLNLVFSITSTVLSVDSVKQYSVVGKDYFVKEDSRVAVIDIGYKDGITKAIGEVVINQRVYKVVADDLDLLYVLVDENVSAKDKVYIISDYNYIDRLLKNLKTNKYYLMSIINNKLKRVYYDKDSIEEIEY